MYANYGTIPDLIKYHTPFKGNSVSATLNWEGFYAVKSYDTVVLVIAPDGQIFIDNGGHSVTTSRIQNIIIRTLGLNYPTKRS